MSPEMQLMRWVRCMLAREFSEQVSLLLWDYILGGVYMTFISEQRVRCDYQDPKMGLPQFQEEFTNLQFLMDQPLKDPLINLEILCSAMILLKTDMLLTADFSTCIGYLWKYELPNPDDPSGLLRNCIEIKQRYVERVLRE